MGDQNHDDEIRKYDQIERWCQAQIKGGSDFFFDPRLFRETLRAKSKQWKFPYEVSKRKNGLKWRDLIILIPSNWRQYLLMCHLRVVATFVDSKLAFIPCQGHGSTCATECDAVCTGICETRNVHTGLGQTRKLPPVYV